MVNRVLDREYREKCRVKASFTVEAAVIVPMILFTIAGGINIGYDMFQEAKTVVEVEEELRKLDPVKIVRNNTMIQEIWAEDGNGKENL